MRLYLKQYANYIFLYHFAFILQIKCTAEKKGIGQEGQAKNLPLPA